MTHPRGEEYVKALTEFRQALGPAVGASREVDLSVMETLIRRYTLDAARIVNGLQRGSAAMDETAVPPGARISMRPASDEEADALGIAPGQWVFSIKTDGEERVLRADTVIRVVGNT